MLVGSLPFVPQPANNIAQLHTLILKGCEIPDSLSEGEADNLYISTWIKTKYINIKSCKQHVFHSVPRNPHAFTD